MPDLSALPVGTCVRFIAGPYKGLIGRIDSGRYENGHYLYYDVVIDGDLGGWTQAPALQLEAMSVVDMLAEIQCPS